MYSANVYKQTDFLKIYLYLPKHIFLYIQRKGYVYEHKMSIIKIKACIHSVG